MRRLIMSRLISTYTVCHSVSLFTLKHLFPTIELSKFKIGRVHFRNSGVKVFIIYWLAFLFSVPMRPSLAFWFKYDSQLMIQFLRETGAFMCFFIYRFAYFKSRFVKGFIRIHIVVLESMPFFIHFPIFSRWGIPKNENGLFEYIVWECYHFP